MDSLYSVENNVDLTTSPKLLVSIISSMSCSFLFWRIIKFEPDNVLPALLLLRLMSLIPTKRHVQCSWNRCCRVGQYIYIFTKLLNRFFMLYTKPLFLIYDKQA